MYYDEQDNISDAQIQSALTILNQDMRRLNPDTANLRAVFKSSAADLEVEFVLAKIGPNGECSNGINRRWNINSLAANNNIKSSLSWPNTKYLNVWVVRGINLAGTAAGTIVLGYSAFPYNGIPGTQDGIVIRHDQLGSIGTAQGERHRTLTHEVGHYLNLFHTFQGGCAFGDQCADTPPVAASSSGCNSTQNTCTVDLPDLPDMIENYMDYSSNQCMNTFTQNQKSRAKAVLTSSQLRGNLASAANLMATGVSGTANCSPVADFEIANPLLCSGEALTLIDRSSSIGTPIYHWNVLSATNQVLHHVMTQNPSLTMPDPGRYTVSLTVQASNGSNTLNKPLSVTVRPVSGTSHIPWFIGTMEEELPNASWATTTFADSSYWRRSTAAAQQGQASYLFQNSKLAAGGEVSALVGGPFAYPNTGTLNLRFAHAFARKASTNNDQLKISVSSNCGETWQLVRIIPAFQLGTAAIVATPYVPAASEWKYTSVNLATLGLQSAGNLMVKFALSSGGGNNLYLDDVQLSTTLSNEELATETVWIQPNPSRSGAILAGAQGEVRVLDLSGRLIWKSYADGDLALPDLPAGSYVLHCAGASLRWSVL
jgi:PKD repeat protein